METQGGSERKKCPDCSECQMCSNGRCSLCRKGGHRESEGGLGPCFTHRRYLEWKREKDAAGAGSEKSENLGCGRSLRK